MPDGDGDHVFNVDGSRAMVRSHSPFFWGVLSFFSIRFVCGAIWLLSCSSVLLDVLTSFRGFGPCGSSHDPCVVLLGPRVGAVMASRSPGRPHSPSRVLLGHGVIVSICRWSLCPIGGWCCCQGIVATRSRSVLCPDVMGGCS